MAQISVPKVGGWPGEVTPLLNYQLSFSYATLAQSGQAILSLPDMNIVAVTTLLNGAAATTVYCGGSSSPIADIGSILSCFGIVPSSVDFKNSSAILSASQHLNSTMAKVNNGYAQGFGYFGFFSGGTIDRLQKATSAASPSVQNITGFFLGTLRQMSSSEISMTGHLTTPNKLLLKVRDSLHHKLKFSIRRLVLTFAFIEFCT